MLTSKERKALSSLGQTIEPTFQIGKNGITESLINELADILEAREIIKISVLNNSDLSAKEIINDLCEELNAEPVSAIGKKIVIYRRSSRKDVKHLEF